MLLLMKWHTTSAPETSDFIADGPETLSVPYLGQFTLSSKSYRSKSKVVRMDAADKTVFLSLSLIIYL